MNLRFRILITALCLCHLLFSIPVVTSQLRPGAALEFPSVAGLHPPPLQLQLQAPVAACSGTITHVHSPGQPTETIIQACEQERTGGTYKANGNVVLTHGNYLLYADHVTYDPKTGDTSETGHVILDGGPNNEHMEASHGAYNVHTDTGTFYDVTGTIGVQIRGQLVTLTTSNPFAFTGKVVDKLGPDHFVVHHGTVTSCKVPHPIWTFNAPRVVVEVGGDAKIYRTTFRVKGVPAFFLPYATHPVQHLARHSGFLMPNFGTSNIKGIMLGDSFYWAINRSMDATIGAEMYSSRGWAERGAYRVAPNEHSFFAATYSGVTDRGYRVPKGAPAACVVRIGNLCKQGGEDVRAVGSTSLGTDARAVVNFEYLSSFIYRLAFNFFITQGLSSEVISNAFATKNFNGYSLNALVERYQDFQSAAPNDIITIRHTPSFDFSSVDRPLGHTPFYWSFDTELGGLSRNQPAPTKTEPTHFFHTGQEVGRFDLRPDILLPLQFHGWDFRPELALRDTAYTQSLTPVPGTVGAVSTEPINRKAVEATIELRPPSLSRVLQHQFFGRKFKHLIEPRLVYHYVSGVDNFSNLLRFDERDVLANTNDVEYGITNRLFAKSMKVDPDCEFSPESSSSPAAAAASAAGAQTAPASTAAAAATTSGAEANSGGAGTAATPAAAPADKTQSSLVRPENEPPSPSSEQCHPPPAREIITWRVAQKRFFNPNFGGAVVPGQPNVFAATVNFTGIAFLTAPANYSPIISRLHVQGGATDAEWDLDYDLQKGRINSSTTLLGYSFGPFGIGGSHAFLQAPGQMLPTLSALSNPLKFNQWRIIGRYGNSNRHGFGVAAMAGVDANLNALQYSMYEANYNFNCCGITFVLQRWAVGPVRTENQFRFAFALANVGTFGTLRRLQRLF